MKIIPTFERHPVILILLLLVSTMLLVSCGSGNKDNGSPVRTPGLTQTSSPPPTMPQANTPTVSSTMPTSPPTLCPVDPPSLNFLIVIGQGDPALQQVTIANCGGPGDWSVSSDSSWLVSSPSHGFVDAGASTKVSIKVSAAVIPRAGPYTGQVTFTLGSSKATVSVTLKIAAPSCRPYNPSSLSFTATLGQGNPADQTVTIFNCAGSESWTASTSTTDGANWLNVNPASGSFNADGTQNVSVVVDITGLAAGNYTGKLFITIGDISVTLTVQEPPSLSPTATSS